MHLNILVVIINDLGFVDGLVLALAGALLLRLRARFLRHQNQLQVPVPCIVANTFWEALRVLLADLLVARSLSLNAWSILSACWYPGDDVSSPVTCRSIVRFDIQTICEIQHTGCDDALASSAAIDSASLEGACQ